MNETIISNGIRYEILASKTIKTDKAEGIRVIARRLHGKLHYIGTVMPWGSLFVSYDPTNEHDRAYYEAGF